MEAPLSVVLVCLSVCFRVARAEGDYDTYKLDSGLCSKNKNTGFFYIKPWKAAILTFGNPPNSNLPPPGRDIHECKVTIRTHKDFGLAAVIQNMSIEATLNKQTRAWECTGDYLKISTTGSSTVLKLFSYIGVDLFKSKTTEELCGVRKGKPRFSEVGSNADVFSTVANDIEVDFHQALKKAAPVNNSFMIVITTFKYIREVAFSDACQERYQCKGSENYCISPKYVCDSNYNCAVPFGGGDELKCKDLEPYHPIFSATTTIITTLAAIVGGGFIVGCLVTLVKKMLSRRSSQSRSVTPRPGLLSDLSAPPLQRQHTLPPYEAVVMADGDPNWKSSTPDPPPPGELPPNYESLFPDGPPKALSTSLTAPSPVPSTNTQSPAPSTEDSQLEQRANAASVTSES